MHVVKIINSNCIGLIKKRGKLSIKIQLKKQKLQEISDEKKKYESNIGIYSSIFRFKDIINFTGTLKSLIKQFVECSEQIESLESSYNELSKEIDQYLKYTDIYTDFTVADFKYLTNYYQVNNCYSEFLYSIILLSINEGIESKEREKIIDLINEILKNVLLPKNNARENFIKYIEQ